MKRYYYLFIFLIASVFALTPFQNIQDVFAADASIVGQWHMDNNWQDSSGNGNHGVPVGTDLTPQMTSDTAPSPYAVTASSYGAPYTPYKAFDHTKGGIGQWVTYTTSGWITFDFGSGNAKAVSTYKVRGPDNSCAYTSSAPKKWTFEGSNDNSNWTVMHTVTEQIGWAASEERLFVPTSSGSYRYYRLNISANNGCGGYTAVDEIMLFSGPAFSTNAKAGTHAGSFDGVDDYVSLPSISHTSSGSIELWFNSNTNINTGTSNEIVLMEGDASGDTNGHFEISLNKADVIAYGNGKLHFYWNGNTGGGSSYGVVSSTTNSWAAGTWYHIVCVATGSQWKIYVNGNLENTANNVNSGLFSGIATYIGAQKNKNRGLYFNGLIDEVAIYNSALSADEIKAHYDAVIQKGSHLPNEISGLKLWYKADAITGLSDGNAVTTWNDSSNSGNNASQSSASQKPIYKTNILNGKPVVRFDGVDDYMAFSSISTIRTAIFVINNTGVTSYPPLLGHSSLYDWHGDSGNYIFSTGWGSSYITNGSAYENGTSAAPGSLLKSPSYKIFTFRTSGNVNAQYITRDRTWAGRVWKGDYAEIIIYDKAITDAERKGVEKYLADKYAITISHNGDDTVSVAQPTVGAVPPVTGFSLITLSGTKSANTSIIVNGTQIYPLDGLTDWQGTYTLQSGTNTLNVRAKDANGYQSQPVTLTVIFDNTAPIISSSMPLNNSDTADLIGNVTINLIDTYSLIDLSASIANATVRNAVGQSIPGTWTTEGTTTLIFTPIEPFPQDTYTVTIYPVDTLGNSGMQEIIFTNHDITPPVTTINLSGTKGSDGWYSTPVTVILTATDSTDGSGVDKTEYSFDGTTWNTYSTPLVLDKDGITIIRYRSTDKAGNAEAPKSQDAKLNQSGIVGQWHMENNWLDSSVYGNTGTPNGALFSPNAKFGSYAGSFDGVDDYVIRNPFSSFPTTEITAEFWMLSSDKTKSGTPISYASSGSDNEFLIYNYNNFAIYRGSAYVTTGVSGNDGKWHYFAVTWRSSNGETKLYKDGVLVYSGVLATGTTIIQGGSLVFGGDQDSVGGSLESYQNYLGNLDEVIIYNRALSPDEIKAHYDAASIAPPSVNPVSSPTASPVITLSGIKTASTAIMVNGTQVYPLDDLTTWQGTYTLQSGMNTLNITAMDSQGYQSEAVTITVALDDTAPTISSSIPANNASVNTPLTSVIFNLTDTYSVIDFAATTNGASVKNSSSQDIPGTWTTSGNSSVIFTPSNPLSQDTYTVTVYPTDSFGNRASAQISFSYDTTAPPAPGINTAISPTNIAAQVISGTKSFDTVAITFVTSPVLTVGTVSYPTNTSWSVLVSGLKEGSNTITAYAKDSAGNQSAGASTVIIYDTVAPAPPTVNDVSPTRNTSVILTGTKDEGSYLYVNYLKTPAPYSDGAWRHTVTLGEGNNTFNVYAKDEAGNQSASVIKSIIRDTTSPKIASSTPSVNAYTNQGGSIDILLSDDYSVVDLTASLTGAVVKSSSGAIISGTWAIQGSHIIFTPSSLLTDGIYTVTLYPIDSLGNTGTVSFSFTMDTTPPQVQSFVMNPTSPHKAETVTFTITFNKAMSTGNQPVVSFGKASPYNEYSLSGGSWVDSKTWRSTFQFTISTGDGTYTVKASDAKDRAGNMMNPVEIGNFILDTIPPETPTLNPVTTPTKIPNQTISGTKPADTAIIINGIERVSLNSSTSWSYTYPLSEGQNNISVSARDAAGNDSTPVTAAITLDTTPPAFTVDSYKNPSPSVTQTISGTKEPNCIVKLNGVTIFDSTDINSTWSYTVTLTQGITNHFVFTASDALGNTRTKTIDILYDISAPAPLGPGILVAAGKGKGTEITLSWPAYVEASDIAYYRIYMSVTDFTEAAGMSPISTTNKGVKTYKVTGLTQGSTYYFAVVPVDISGNFDPAVNTATGVPADTVPPEEVTITSVTAGYDAVNGNYITINWNPSVNSAGDLADQIIYVDDGKGYDAGTSIGKTVTTYTKTGLNDATEYKFRITVKDALGHESTGVLTKGVTRLNNPTGLTANPGNGKAALSWTPVSSPYIKAYRIYRAISDIQKTDISQMTLISQLTTLNSQLLTYLDIGLTNGTTYQYAVTVINTYGAERTDVSSVSANPRMDTTGPVISNFNIIQGQVITAPITISASASDAESSMGKIELYIDGALVKTQTGVSLSYFYNVIETTDGNHTIKLIAYDQYGNATEELRQVVVSLAPPATPAITGHTVVQTTPEYLVNISGTAPISTTVILRVNGIVVGTVPDLPAGAVESGLSPFTFTSVELIEGDNLLSVKASHRGGESPYSPDYKITVDTGAPPSPQNLTSQILPGGVVRFTWQNATGEIPSGYNLYMSTSAFTSKTSSGVSKVNISPITYLFKEYIQPDDSLRYYGVTALDSSGNESEISNVISIASDRTAPTVTSIEYEYTPSLIPSPPAGEGQGGGVTVVGPGSVKVVVTVSEPLKDSPFFSLEPLEGSPIVLSMKKIDDIHYEGSFNVTALSPHGPTTYKFSGKDMVGNRGNSQGTGINIDIKGPAASIQSPLTLLQIKPEPIEVSLVFDEPSVSLPLMELRSSNGLSSPITNLTSSDSGIHWTGVVDISLLSEGQAEFILSEAKDLFGNIGTTVSSGKTILVYKDSVPSPDVPTGLTAKSGKGGTITLQWQSVVSSQQSVVTYNLYRRGENETTPTVILNSVQNLSYTDLPPTEGTYYYSISSVGLLGSESQRSEEVQAVSDRTGPVAPTNISLALDGSGVTAVWDAPNPPIPPLEKGGEGGFESPKSYNLYRSSGPITSTYGLTPVTSVSITKAVDTAPMQSKRFYAVTALDELGNEGPPSESREIVFPVSPVRNLVLERLDNAAPSITWQSPADGNIIGYHIYRNGNRITQYPATVTSYTDGYYSGGTVTYGISAINDLWNESPIKEVMLPDLSIGVKEGTVLRRGLMETVSIVISNNAPQPPLNLRGGEGELLTIDTISIKVGTAPSSTLQGPFTLSLNSSLQIEKVIATSSDASSPVAVLTTAIWSPSPGVTVKITKTSSAEVTGSSTALEIYSEPLIRGVDAKVRLKVNNLGTSQMEFLTSENSGETKKVKVTLKDQDGNLLSTGYLNQRTGSMIVNIGSYAVARLNPNENIITEPITLNVPTGAPYKVIIEAKIENTYYHYGKSDQVVAPGMTQSIETTISETAYRAFASPEKTFYPNAQPVLITGQAISNTLTPGTLEPSTPMPFVPVKLGISIKGFDRFFTVTTDATGAFTYTFTPGANEAGLYTIWAVHPDIKDRAVQATFAIAGLSMSPETATVRMTRNRTIDIPLNLYNYGGGTLTGLTFETTAGNGITANVINGGDNLLTAGEQQSITLRITSSSTAPDTSYATMKAYVNEGLSKTLNANISIVQLIPVITTSPSYIDTGMVRGNQKIATFNISNAGEETLRNARIEGPSTSWMSLTVNKAIGDMQPGVSKTIGIMFSPPSTLSQGVYDDRVVIYSDNHIPYTYHIQVTVTSNAVGNVLFDVLNELMEDVPNATITLQHQTLTELIYTLRTGADGTVMLYDIPEGRYTYNVSPPPGHTPYSGTFTIQAGMTTTVPIALEMTMVTVTWSVTPTVIQDKYEIVVTQTFETNVPAPVLIVEPPNINLPVLQPGQVFNGEFKVTNYGLIEVYDVVLDFPRSIDDYDIEVMTSAIPNKIGAMKSITVPYRITRRITTASLIKSLFEEVTGYGGGNCVKNFNITIKGKCVICPNTAYARVVEKIANFILSLFYDCPTTITPSTPPTYTLPGGTQIYINSTSTTGQGTGGNISGTSTTPIQTSNPCNCKDEGTILPDSNTHDCQKQACVNGSPRTIADDGEKPVEECKECSSGGLINKQDGTFILGETNVYCCYQGSSVLNSPIVDFSKCPSRKAKGWFYDPAINGCGPQQFPLNLFDGVIPDNPMWFFHKNDEGYRALHGENDGNFLDPCNAHDSCYGTCNPSSGGTSDDAYRSECDTTLGERLREICDIAYAGQGNEFYRQECWTYAGMYEFWVTSGGQKSFDAGQKEGCNCCY